MACFVNWEKKKTNPKTKTSKHMNSARNLLWSVNCKNCQTNHLHVLLIDYQDLYIHVHIGTGIKKKKKKLYIINSHKD
jgi:hypothetical protein